LITRTDYVTTDLHPFLLFNPSTQHTIDSNKSVCVKIRSMHCRLIQLFIILWNSLTGTYLFPF